jgi:2-C-methyl-D-erythritol 4-phosphate cytidylyltransferase
LIAGMCRSTGLVLAAAGSGSRLGGGCPKQFREMLGRPLYLYSLEAFQGVVSRSAVVVPAEYVRKVEKAVSSVDFDAGEVVVVAGGSSRQDSVRRGLAALDDSVEFVLVHDAARPAVSPALIERVLLGTVRWGACIPVIPVQDTVKEVREGVVVRTIPREELALAQTPQGTRAGLLREALEKAADAGFVATDESRLLEWSGVPVHTVEGDVTNLKVTWPEDLDRLGTGLSGHLRGGAGKAG